MNVETAKYRLVGAGVGAAEAVGREVAVGEGLGTAPPPQLQHMSAAENRAVSFAAAHRSGSAL